jgi:hypothetical protein
VWRALSAVCMCHDGGLSLGDIVQFGVQCLYYEVDGSDNKQLVEVALSNEPSVERFKKV